MQQTKKRIVYLVRHGQRKDRLPEFYEEMKNHPDTPITALGKKQAQETGIFLSQLLKQYPNAKVILESSPYIRCQQTAAMIACQIGVSQCLINYKFGEWLSNYLFQQNPVPHLEYFTQPLNEMDQKFDLQKIQFINSEDFANEYCDLYPESKKQGLSRLERNVSEMQLMCEKQQELLLVQIIVTHGFFVDESAVKKFKNGYYCGYCAVTGLEISAGDQKIKRILEADSSHVTIQD